MSIHIEAKEGDIAETILLPGDPLRAKYIAENFLEDIFCYNKVRGMYGYTGFYKKKEFQFREQVWEFHLFQYMLMNLFPVIKLRI